MTASAEHDFVGLLAAPAKIARKIPEDDVYGWLVYSYR